MCFPRGGILRTHITPTRLGSRRALSGPSHYVPWTFSGVSASCLLSLMRMIRTKHPANARYAVCFRSLTTMKKAVINLLGQDSAETLICSRGMGSWEEESRVTGEEQLVTLLMGLSRALSGRGRASQLTDLPPPLSQHQCPMFTSILAHLASLHLSSESEAVNVPKEGQVGRISGPGPCGLCRNSSTLRGSMRAARDRAHTSGRGCVLIKLY